MELTILGGGVAGVSAAYMASKCAIPFALFEAEESLGGAARTLTRDGFRFDSGAHRLHDRDAEVTGELRKLLGDELQLVTAPSRVYHGGRFLHFPLSPLDLARNLGVTWIAKAARDLLFAKLRRRNGRANFAEYVIRRYGHTIARDFLLDYSEKLWGISCRELSVDAAGRRLQGLGLLSILREVLRDRARNDLHLDGAFYYPTRGIGSICEALAQHSTTGSLRMQSRVTAITHDGRRVCTVHTRNASPHPVDELVSTLPITTFLGLLDPQPERSVLGAARCLQFRNVVLVALFLDRESVSSYASTYFPGPDFPFTRVHEPRCRSELMSPPGQTSLVAEIPCFPDDPIWRTDDSECAALVVKHLANAGLAMPEEVAGWAVHRVSHAYPVLRNDVTEHLQRILNWIARLQNVRLIGRPSTFTYCHIHDLTKRAFDTVRELHAARRSCLATPTRRDLHDSVGHGRTTGPSTPC